MAGETKLYEILSLFSSKQNTSVIQYNEFYDYLKRYAQHHIESQPNLLPYITSTAESLNKDLLKLIEQKKVFIINPDTDKKAIVVTAFLIDFYYKRYREIENNLSIPYPVVQDLPRQVPDEVYEKQTVTDLIYKSFNNELSDTNNLYALIFTRELPMLLYPSSLPLNNLVDISINKIRFMLRKDEYHDYFLKKLRSSNPGKELSVKNFFSQIITRPSETLDSLKTSSDAFYLWNQLCFFIRQDYEKIKDLTVEHVSILQAIQITETAITYFKTKFQQDQQRLTALKNLELILGKPPYFFNNDSIARFVDSRGVPLLGQYSEQDLNEWLHEASTSLENKDLPKLLVFKLETEQRFFILKTRVIPLIVRLASESREHIAQAIVKDWFKKLKAYEAVPAIKDQKAFEELLEQIVKNTSPVLYALLTANFLPLVHYETRSTQNPVSDKINLFVNGKRISYSELLMLNRHELHTDAKIMLPFWHSIPFFSWLIGLFLKKPNPKKTKQPKEIQKPEDEKQDKEPSRKEELKKNALEIEKKLVPAGSTLEKELLRTLNEWNRILNTQAREDLTEDVNALIRDYFRKILRSLKSHSFTKDRVENLAKTLVNTPALQKIQDKKELETYIQLYILQIVKKN